MFPSGKNVQSSFRTAPLHTLGPCEANKARNAMILGRLQRVCVCMALPHVCCLWILYASSLSSACVFDSSRTKTEQKKPPSQTCLDSHSRTVRTQKGTTRADYWPHKEAMCMASRHRPPFMDEVGLNPLSGILCVFCWSYAKQPHQKKKRKKNQHRSALQNTFV